MLSQSAHFSLNDTFHSFLMRDVAVKNNPEEEVVPPSSIFTYAPKIPPTYRPTAV